MNRRALFVLAFIVSFIVITGIVVAADPYGASTVTSVSNDTGNGSAVSPSSHAAIAGNVTEITVTGTSVTKAWQGYFGNVSGTIQLADSSNNVMYNWTGAEAVGEIFASTDNGISWPDVECFNYTIDGAVQLNLTGLESAYNISSTDGDGVDETFVDYAHAQFTIGSTTFSSGDCNATQVYGPGGAGAFDEAILIDTSQNETVFVSILDDDTTGFDNAPHDFEMLVLEDGHNGDASVTTYYFYVDLG